MIQLIVNLTSRRGQVFRCDGLIPDFKITTQQQIENPKLGLITDSAAGSDIHRAIDEAIMEATKAGLEG